MNAPPRRRTFRSGNSVAIRLPAALGIGEGVEMTVEPDGRGLRLQPVSAEDEFIDLAGIYGSVPGLGAAIRAQRVEDEAAGDWGSFTRDG